MISPLDRYAYYFAAGTRDSYLIRPHRQRSDRTSSEWAFRPMV